MPDVLSNTEGPQEGSPLSLNGRSYRARPTKEAFRSPATRGSEKDCDGAVTPAAEAARVPAHLALPGSLQAELLRHLHARLSVGQSCHRQ